MVSTLKIRESVILLEENPTLYQAIFTASRKITTFQIDAFGRELIDYLKESHTEDEITSRFSSYEPQVIRDYTQALRDLNLLSEKRNIPDRHKRQVMFIDELASSSEESERMQRQLTDSKVAVFGVGGIGSWIVNGLAQLGVYEIRVSDPDVVSESNLNRQILYNSRDIGRYKVDVLKERLPDTRIVTHKTRVTPDSNLNEIINGVDFIMNCADSPSVQETSRIIDGYARPLGIPYSVAGGYNMHLGMVGSIIVPNVTACFDCFLSHQRDNDPLKDMKVIKNVEETGNLGAIAGTIANLHVMDFFKFMTGKGKPNLNRFAEIDFMDLSVEWREFKPRENCPTCSKSIKNR